MFYNYNVMEEINRPLTHMRLLVVNFSECFRFYRDVLQLRPHWGDEADSYASFTQGQDDKVALAIFSRQSMSVVLGTDALPLDPPGQDTYMLIFEVGDVDAEVARIRQMGVKIEQEPTNFPDWGYRGAFVRDPDGTLIELSGAIPAELWSDGLREANEKYQAR